MKFVKFNFTKIKIERLSDNLKDLNINAKIDISNLEVIENFNQNNKKLLKIFFKYYLNYEPNFVKIEFFGEIFISEESKIVEEIIEEWNKNKKINENFKIFFFNILLRKCNLKALQLEDELDLPTHLPLQAVKKENSSKKNNP